MSKKFRMELPKKRLASRLAIILLLSTSILFSAIYSYLRTGTVQEAQAVNLAAFERMAKGKVLAVMVWSPTCPHCEEMMPYWRRVEEAGVPGVEVTDVMYMQGVNDDLMVKYGIEETPTFLLLVDGQPVARHVGVFAADNITEAMLEWISRNSAGSSVESGGGGGGVSSYSLAAYPVLGVLIALSPCVLPVLAVFAGMGSSGIGRRECIFCGAASFVGTLGLGVLIVAAASIAARVLTGFNALLASIAVFMGVYSILGGGPGPSMGRLASSGMKVACLGFGLIALQCSLPLVGGALALAGTSGSLIKGFLAVSLLALGLSATVTVVLMTAREASGLVSRLTGNPRMVEAAGGLILVVAGLYVLIAG